MKAHQDRVPHLRRFDPRQTPPVQLEYAIYAMQRARDDAHIAAWRDAGLTGPMIELLSRVWTDTTTTVDHLAEHARGRMLAADVTETVEKLKRASCIVVNSITITITRFGRDVRDWIEDEADRMYFAPWPEIDGIRDKPDRSSRNRNAVPARHGFGDSAERCWNLATLFDATSGCLMCVLLLLRVRFLVPVRCASWVVLQCRGYGEGRGRGE